jgi:hypothetical protein
MALVAGEREWRKRGEGMEEKPKHVKREQGER